MTGEPLPHQLQHVGRGEAPLNDAAVAQFAADALTDQGTVEGVHVADAAHHEHPLVAGQHLDPGPRRALAPDRLGVVDSPQDQAV
jgi:hypothetical protein